jgi:membrane fusion protein (multidrug efflux system)
MKLSYLWCAALMVWVGCNDRQGETTTMVEVPVPVRVEPLELEPYCITYHTIGKIESAQQVNLFFEVPGQVDSLFVEEGDQVVTGQPLAKLEQESYRANFVRARSAFEKARRDLASAEELYRQNIVSKDQYEQARLGFDNAQAGFIQARTALENTVLTAPFPGRIIQRNLEVGEVVAPGVAAAPPFVLADLKRLKVVVSVPESDIGRIRAGLPVELTFKSYPDRVVRGTVHRVGLSTRPLSNTFAVEIAIEAPDEGLRLGLVAEVTIILQEFQQEVVLPLRLIHEEKGGKFVYIVRDDRVHRVPVEVVDISGSRVLVRGDLPPGTLLITAGHHDVREGTLVTMVKDEDRRENF